jgi:CheY-like chemotaxis protein
VDKQALTVLVVDDDGTVAEMLKDMLSLLGHTVLAVTDPCVAAQLLGERSVDLMITDLDLPGMTGWQLARQVRDLQPGIMVGLVTGWPLGASDHELTARGVDFVLAKPFSGDALQASIEKLRSTR